MSTAVNNNARKEYLPIPEGEYSVTLDRVSDVTASKSGKGEYVNVTFKVNEGDHQNRLIFDRFMLKHENPNVTKIGNDRLNKFIQAAGRAGGYADLDYDITQLNDLIGSNIIARVKIEPGTNGYKDKNKVSSFVKR